MRIYKILERRDRSLRDPNSDEAQLTVHVEDEHILRNLLQERADGEIVERHARQFDGISTIYIRCTDNDSASELMEAWAPFLPHVQRLPTEWIVGRPIAHSYRFRSR